MLEVTVRTHVDAPPERVWGLIGDPTRMGEWSPECQRVEWRGASRAPAVGATFRGHNRLGWRRWTTTGRVVELEPGRTIAWDVSLVLPVARWTYRVEPADGAGCTLEETFTDQRGAVIKALGTLGRGVTDVEAHNRRGMEATLARIRAAAEGH